MLRAAGVLARCTGRAVQALVRLRERGVPDVEEHAGTVADLLGDVDAVVRPADARGARALVLRAAGVLARCTGRAVQALVRLRESGVPDVEEHAGTVADLLGCLLYTSDAADE